MRDLLMRSYCRSPDHPAKYRIVQALGRYVFPRDGVISSVDGLRFRLHPRDWIEYQLLSGLLYEPATLSLLRAELREGDAAILAGVNFGQHVAVAARAVGATGRVIGVEPQPAAVLRAQNNLALNGLQERVTLVQAALGRSAGLKPMVWADPRNTGAASLLDAGPGFICPIVRIDDVISQLDGRRIRLLLLDVQGYEWDALQGLDLRANGPDIAVIELDPTFLERAHVQHEQIATWFRDAGYRLSDVFGGTEPILHQLPERNLVARRV